ncbi:metal-dependent hydrolase [Aureivirga sp. CE67]|uniref:metal-dependent hydrolase n=1 Tax=Aureivirga sp. CE67 TaxID=1788983 RepID=UPI0018C975E6|nr:metal-dependent hydrolase [Aureivirga sp. CE67]
MDLISHMFTGLAVGSVLANFSTKNWKHKLSIIFFGGLGGALPDFDAISLWSKFDMTFGKLFQLSHSGKDIYFGKFWYSHHGAMHSIFAILLFILLFFLFKILFQKKFKTKNILSYFKEKQLIIFAFALGYFCHLLEDMPTPASVWRGVNLLFPSKNYVGGFGKIWWWNNYDLFLIIFSVFSLNILLNFFPNTLKHLKSKIACSIFFFGLILFLYQINTRSVDFSYTGHTKNYQKMEQQSKEIQKQILGTKLYNKMAWLDSKIPLYF